MQNKLEKSNNALEDYKHRVRELHLQLKKEPEIENDEIDNDLEELIKEGYPKEMLHKMKKNIHSSHLRRKLKSIIKKYSLHESAKPQRMRMKIINEIISSEKVYLDQLKKVIKNFYHPLLIEGMKKKKIFFFFLIFYLF